MQYQVKFIQKFKKHTAKTEENELVNYKKTWDIFPEGKGKEKEKNKRNWKKKYSTALKAKLEGD